MKRQLSIAVTLAAAAFARAGEPVPLQMNLQPGQSWHFDDAQDTDQQNTATSNGQQQPFTTKTHQHLLGTMEVVNVVNGAPTALKITFDAGSEISNEFNGTQNKIPFPYGTNAITLTRQPDGSVTDDFQGQVPPQAAAELHSLMERDLVLMPAKPVSIGDEWPGDPATMGRFLQIGPKGSGGMTMKLLGVKNIGGRQLAELKVSMAVVNAEGELSMKAIAQGVSLVDLSTGHAIQGDFNGTIELKGIQPGAGPNGQQIKYGIEGKGTMKVTAKSPLDGVPAGGEPTVPTPSSAAPSSANSDPAPVAPAGGAANPLDPSEAIPFAGAFSDGKLQLDLQPAGNGLSGAITLGGKKYPTQATATGTTLSGTFQVGAKDFSYTATMQNETLTLVSGGTSYNLKKVVVNPLDAPAANPLSPK